MYHLSWICPLDKLNVAQQGMRLHLVSVLGRVVGLSAGAFRIKLNARINQVEAHRLIHHIGLFTTPSFV